MLVPSIRNSRTIRPVASVTERVPETSCAETIASMLLTGFGTKFKPDLAADDGSLVEVQIQGPRHIHSFCVPEMLLPLYPATIAIHSVSSTIMPTKSLTLLTAVGLELPMYHWFALRS